MHSLFRRPTTLTSALLTSVSAAMLLAACSSGGVMGALTKEKPRANTAAVGERRIPEGNTPTAPTFKPEIKPGRTKPAAQSSFEENPFDHFDSTGKRVDPTAEAPKAATPAGAEEEGFFSRITNSFKKPDTAETAPASAEPTQAPAVQQPKIERKRFGAQKHSDATPAPKMEEPSAVSVPAHTPVADAPAVQENETSENLLERTWSSFTDKKDTPEKEPAIDLPKPHTADSSLTERVQEAPHVEKHDTEIKHVDEIKEEQKEAANDKPSFLNRALSTVQKPFEEEEPSTPPVMADENEHFDEKKALEYPTLSSVPPTPEQFQSLRAAKDQKMEGLQDEHTLANEEREMLERELSQQNAEPVEAPKAEATPVIEPKEQEAKATPAETTDNVNAEPELLGHARDSKSPVVFPDVQKEIAKEHETTKPEALVAEPKAEEPAAEKPSLLGKLNPFREKPSDNEATSTEVAPAEAEAPEQPAPVAEQTPIAAEPVQAAKEEKSPKRTNYFWQGWGSDEELKDEENANEEAAPATDVEKAALPAPQIAPMTAEKPTQLPALPAQSVEEAMPVSALPSLSPAAAPVDAVSEDDGSEEAGLPSTTILKNTRTLPTSRYNERLRHKKSSH